MSGATLGTVLGLRERLFKLLQLRVGFGVCTYQGAELRNHGKDAVN
jgi:hypothetical protein